MQWMTRMADKTGALGSIVSAASCPACFPAIASLGAAAGLGFLSEFEGLFLTILLPLFAAVALFANAAGWFSHRQWHRSLIGMIGPAIVLVALLLFFGQWRTAWLLYVGLGSMVGVSLWDLMSPATRRCGGDGCEALQIRPPNRDRGQRGAARDASHASAVRK